MKMKTINLYAGINMLLISIILMPGCTKDKVQGCTDAAATNYNADAEENDGSCNYVWVQANIPGDGYPVTSIVNNGTKIFAGTGTSDFEQDVLISNDNGDTWTSGNTNGMSFVAWGVGTITPGVLSLAIKGNNIYAGTVSGMFYSNNDAANWTQATASSADFGNSVVSKVTTIGSNILAGTGRGIFLSSDNGNNEVQVYGDSMHYYDVRAFAPSGTTILAGGNGGVISSTDNGNTWSELGSLNEFVTALAVSGSTIYAGTEDGGVYISTNSGNNWSVVNNGLPNNSNGYKYVYSLVISGANVFAATSDGVFMTTNNGGAWTDASNGLVVSAPVFALSVMGNKLFAGNNTGIWVRPLSN